jgi:hypothetical protein
MKKIKTPKMTRRKLKKIRKQKTFKVHMKKCTYPISSLVKLHTQKIEAPQNDKKKIKDSKTSKYENKKLSKFTRRKANIPLPPCKTSHNSF